MSQKELITFFIEECNTGKCYAWSKDQKMEVELDNDTLDINLVYQGEIVATRNINSKRIYIETSHSIEFDRKQFSRICNILEKTGNIERYVYNEYYI